MSFLTSLVLSTLTIGNPAPTYTFAYDTPPTPVCGSTIHTLVGQTVSFTIQVTNTDPNDAAALYVIVLPPGATLSDPNPIVVFGNGVDPIVMKNTFTWTPGPGDVGDNVVYWDSANLGGVRLPCTVTIRVETEPVKGCSYTQGGWGSKPSGNNPGMILKNGFATAFPSGIEIGVPGAAGYSLKFTSASAVEKFLPQGGAPGALKADATNPTSRTAAGVFAGQVLALAINVQFSAAGLIGNGPIGSLKLVNSGQLDGKTIADVLADANQVLGGGVLPYGYTSISQLNDLVTNLNEAFDNCEASSWASGHLAK